MTVNDFQFTTVPSIVMASGASSRLGELLTTRYSIKNVCVVTDKFLASSGLLKPMLDDLEKHGLASIVIDDVIADPPDHVVLSAAQRAKDGGAELVLGIGGGSSMDVAKLVAVLAVSTQPLHEMYGVNNVMGPRLPLVLAPTTSGTGSEVTAVSIVTTGETTKSGIVSPRLVADIALLDADLTFGLPRDITAATGIDAMVHAIEAYTSARLKNPVSDLYAKKALKLLSSSLLTACNDGSNRAARESMMLGSTMAGLAFSNAPVAAVHALAYPLGGHFHVPHGLSNALVLMHVLRFNAPKAAHLYAELAEDVLESAAISGMTIPERCDAFIEQLDTLIRQTGLPTMLRHVGVGVQDLPRLAADAMLQQRLLINNPREVTEADALRIYQDAL
ncbi:iron-containing alcohol dehydrogenase [Paraburkholderia sp. C35]|uniref:iron-containing alcohol dehydrogenase n=1 Tax=Paraburkholderia sp. C35 TaxID=2126993 RepID=UPI000D69F1F8|nr:iron-containing alcohol dehydrogenase [Paraburkholderia sp. C35]